MNGNSGKKDPAGGRTGRGQTTASGCGFARPAGAEALAHRLSHTRAGGPAPAKGPRTPCGARRGRAAPGRGAAGFSQSIVIEAMGGCLGKNECPPPPLSDTADTEQQEEATHSLGWTYCWALPTSTGWLRPPPWSPGTRDKNAEPRALCAAPCVALKASPRQQTCDLSAGTHLVETQGPD